MKRARFRIERAMRRIVRRDDADFVQRQCRFGRFAGAKVSVMNRVERAAQHAEATFAAHALRRARALRRAAPIRSIVSCSPGSGMRDPGSGRRTPFAISFHAASSSLSTPSPVAAEILKNGSFCFFTRRSSACTRWGSSTASILLAATICGLAATSGENSSSSSRIVVEVLDGIAARRAGHVNEMHEHLRPLDVPKKLVPEAVAFVRALDQPGDVCDDEAAIVAQRDDAQVWHERGERIVGDLRARGGDPRDQRGLAGVGESNQTHIRDQLQLQAKQLLFAVFARLGPSRRAVGGRHEAGVAATAATAFGDQHALAFLGEIAEQAQACACRILFEDERADRNGNLEVVGGVSGAIRPLAVLAAPCFELGMKAEVDERVLGGCGDDEDGAAAAAVAAVRTAARDELLAPEAQAAIAAGACLNVDVDFVDEHVSQDQETRLSRGRERPGPDRSLLFDRNDADLAAVLAVILEADLAVDLGEERVVLAEADVQARLESTSLLAHQDRPAGDEIAVVTLHAEALRIAVAAVA